MPNQKFYDLIAVGTGGATKLVRPVADLGYKVAVIEKGKLGGTCLNHGCIPSKMLIHPADLLASVREFKRQGIEGKITSINFQGLVERVNRTIDSESESIRPLYEAHENIDLYSSIATFKDSNTLLVDGEELVGEKIILGVGAQPLIPPIEGLQETPYLTYKEALRLKEKPESMIILGGGYIATELGHFFSEMGVHTHFIVRSELLRREDQEVKEEFSRAFRKNHQVNDYAETLKVEFNSGQFTVTYKQEQELKQVIAETLLVATGVQPATEALNVDQAGITLDPRGYIQVDSFLKTSNPKVWALGDCVGKYLFRHSANFEGEWLFNHLFKEEKNPISYPPMPHAVFSRPQVGRVGLSEDECIDQKIPYIAARNDYKNSAMGMALLSDSGFVKLLFHRETRRLIGGHIIGDEASNMVHMLIAYMNMDATLDDLLRTIYIHPALPELIRNAARKAQAQFSA